MTDRELMQQALDALELAKSMSDEGFVLSHTGVLAEPIEALRVRLAQPEQEPVAWMYNGNLHLFDPSDWADGTVTPLYNSPPQRECASQVHDRREWQGLTLEEIDAVYEDVGGGNFDFPMIAHIFGCAIEAKLREKNS